MNHRETREAFIKDKYVRGIFRDSSRSNTVMESDFADGTAIITIFAISHQYDYELHSCLLHQVSKAVFQSISHHFLK